MLHLYPPVSMTAVVLLIVLGHAHAADRPPRQQEKIRLDIEKPKQAYQPRPGVYCGPKELVVRMEPPSNKPPVLMVPGETRLLSRGKPVTSSDQNILVGSPNLITNGDKEASHWNRVELRPGVQWVQIDLKESPSIAAVALWHDHAAPYVYLDVVVQLSNDADFADGVTTIFNNDHDNSIGLGPGADKLYVESHHGELIDAKATRARYVRLYSNGNTADDMNHYTEVEVYGAPAAAGGAYE